MEPPTYEKTVENAPAPPQFEPFQSRFASVSLHRTDRLRFIGFARGELAAITTLMWTKWRKGVQSEQLYGSAHEIKLRGHPWSGQFDDAVTSRVLMRELLAHLYRRGWILHMATDVSKTMDDKDTLFFRKQEAQPPESDWLSISFNETDKLRVMGADTDLLQAIGGHLIQMKLLQENRGWKDKSLGAYEYKLVGRPWRASGEATMITRNFLLRLLQCLETHGWSLYASIDQSTGHSDQCSETDSWYCVKDKQWVEGMAVFHR